MSRKHNVRKERSPSGYPGRLAMRGESSASVRMPFIDKWGRKFDTPEQMVRAAAPRKHEDSVAA